MQKLIFYLIYPPIWVISKLPFWLLYRVSDFLFLIVYYLIGYRKKLVLYNLQLVFPEKSKQELLKIRRKFYRHFVDIFMEMIKTFTISLEELDKHYVVLNNDLLVELAKKGKSAIVVGSHYGNWEWAVKIGQNTDFQRFGIYAKIKNEIFSNKVKSSRERFGLKLILKSDTVKIMGQNAKNNILGIYGFLSDQSPRLRRAYYWTDFLGQHVPVLTGAEVLAKKHDMALVFIKINKVKRGYYAVEFQLITENPNEYKDYDITDKYLDLCEKQIREKPEYYFWTHNRFKHLGKENLSPK